MFGAETEFRRRENNQPLAALNETRLASLAVDRQEQVTLCFAQVGTLDLMLRLAPGILDVPTGGIVQEHQLSRLVRR